MKAMIGKLRITGLATLLLITGLAGVAPASAQDSTFDPAAFTFNLEPVANGLSLPVWLADPDDDTGRFFIVEQTGRVMILQDGALLENPFLDVSGQITTGYEQGLLSIALHPGFADNGTFFVFYTDLDGNTQIERWTVSADDPNLADPASAETLLSIEDFAPNHNGGLLLFGPDGMLYIGLGDGGGGGDPEENGQDNTQLLGKILRIDVDSTTDDLPYGIPDDNPFIDVEGARAEIWATGLRNPWRFSFDRETGDFYVGDVGQGEVEEASAVPSGESGYNFGWNLKEGLLCYATDPCSDPAFTDPFFSYDHSQGGCTIVGGYVYRGEAIASLQGTYVTGDYCSGQVWGVEPTTGSVSDAVETGLQISSFAEDASGELYILDLDGGVYRIVP